MLPSPPRMAKMLVPGIWVCFTAKQETASCDQLRAAGFSPHASNAVAEWQKICTNTVSEMVVEAQQAAASIKHNQVLLGKGFPKGGQWGAGQQYQQTFLWRLVPPQLGHFPLSPH